MIPKKSCSTAEYNGTNLRKAHFPKPISDFKIITLIGLAFFVLQSCDLFGQDEPVVEQNTEFTFEVDTLSHFDFFILSGYHQRGINAITILSDTSFVLYGHFMKNSASPSEVYNQVWWSKSLGYRFINQKFPIHNGEGFYHSTSIVYQKFVDDKLLFGGSTEYLELDLSTNETAFHYLADNYTNDKSYRNILPLTKNHIYLFGIEGSIGLFKDKKFTKINTGVDHQFSHAAFGNGKVIIYGQRPMEDFQTRGFVECVLGQIVDTTFSVIDRWELKVQSPKPTLVTDMLYEKGKWYFYGTDGIYSYNGKEIVYEFQHGITDASFVNKDFGLIEQNGIWISLYYKKEMFLQTLPFEFDSNIIYDTSFNGKIMISIMLNKNTNKLHILRGKL